MASAVDKSKLLRVLDELAGAVEELLLSGLTTASETTRQALQIALQEATRFQLLRLAGTLRVASEELGRFTRNAPDFSRKRLMFFLNRAWLLATGLARAVREENQSLYDRLLWTPANAPVARLDVVTLGVSKKVASGAFVAFEFRLRTVEPAAHPAGELPAGTRLVSSCVFPLKAGTSVPPEGFLHLPQKQKFRPTVFLERKVVRLERVAVALDSYGGGRISLGESSTVVAGDSFTDWMRIGTWDVQSALDRIRSHTPSPFDLEIELQEEAVLSDWTAGEPVLREETGQHVYPVRAGGGEFDGVVSSGEEGHVLRKQFDTLATAEQRPPLFGLVHYELGRMVLQPLATLTPSGPSYLTISETNMDAKELVRLLKF